MGGYRDIYSKIGLFHKLTGGHKRTDWFIVLYLFGLFLFSDRGWYY